MTIRFFTRVRHLAFAALAIVLFCLPSPPRADVPNEVDFQGVLRDANGGPFTGSVNRIEVRIYEAATGASGLLYEEAHTDVPLTNGVF